MSDSFPNLIKELSKLAEQDGIITKDELKIIDSVEIDLKLYNSAHKKALENGIIDEEEAKNLLILRDQILENALKTAKADGYVDIKERNLLKKLLTVIHSFVNDK